METKILKLNTTEFNKYQQDTKNQL